MRAAGLMLISLISLAGCGEKSSQQPAADPLHNAAEQSDPAAAPVLENAANSAEMNAALSDPNGAAQQALENAGAAQAKTARKP